MNYRICSLDANTEVKNLGFEEQLFFKKMGKIKAFSHECEMCHLKTYKQNLREL